MNPAIASPTTPNKANIPRFRNPPRTQFASSPNAMSMHTPTINTTPKILSSMHQPYTCDLEECWNG